MRKAIRRFRHGTMMVQKGQNLKVIILPQEKGMFQVFRENNEAETTG